MKKLKTISGSEIRLLAGGRSNVFLVSNNRIKILIDTGPAFSGNRLLKKLEQLSISSIDYLLLTHTHFDHAANAQKLKDKFGLKVIVHEAEAGYLLSGNSPVPAGTNSFTSWLIGTFGDWTEKKVRYQPCEADIIIKKENEFSFPGIDARIIHTPGHSAGSVCLIVDNEIALAGDTLIGTFSGSCFPPFANDVPELMRSWEKILKTGCRLFLPSHGNARTRQVVERALIKKKKTIC
ncbi:MAG: MBL fold metallo-hydrolase [Bacteroidales bacterium]|nr:MBL fold metallo-hydrolase [Bacteroidales bacterium]